MVTYKNFVGHVVEENVSGVGSWGGECTCPDGQKYQVGDNEDSCGSLACVNGQSGVCNQSDGAWSKRKVTCAGKKYFSLIHTSTAMFYMLLYIL